MRNDIGHTLFTAFRLVRTFCIVFYAYLRSCCCFRCFLLRNFPLFFANEEKNFLFNLFFKLYNYCDENGSNIYVLVFFFYSSVYWCIERHIWYFVFKTATLLSSNSSASNDNVRLCKVMWFSLSRSIPKGVRVTFEEDQTKSIPL